MMTHYLTDFLDKRLSGLTENLMKKSSRDDSLTRSMSGVSETTRSMRSQVMSDKRSSWYEREETAMPNLDTFRPVTLTVSSFFKQVGLEITTLRYLWNSQAVDTEAVDD